MSSLADKLLASFNNQKSGDIDLEDNNFIINKTSWINKVVNDYIKFNVSPSEVAAGSAK